jgi:hypothetical protein
MEYIVKKLDELSQKVDVFSNGPSITSSSRRLDGAEQSTEVSRAPCPYPSTSIAPLRANNSLKDLTVASKAEYEGGSSLSAHAIFATRYLQDAVSSTNSPDIAREMTSILNALHKMINDRKQQRDTLENLYPHAKPIPHGSSTRHLPMPPVEMTLTCLRMARGTLYSLSDIWSFH